MSSTSNSSAAPGGRAVQASQIFELPQALKEQLCATHIKVDRLTPNGKRGVGRAYIASYRTDGDGKLQCVTTPTRLDAITQTPIALLPPSYIDHNEQRVVLPIPDVMRPQIVREALATLIEGFLTGATETKDENPEGVNAPAETPAPSAPAEAVPQEEADPAETTPEAAPVAETGDANEAG